MTTETPPCEECAKLRARIDELERMGRDVFVTFDPDKPRTRIVMLSIDPEILRREFGDRAFDIIPAIVEMMRQKLYEWPDTRWIAEAQWGVGSIPR